MITAKTAAPREGVLGARELDLARRAQQTDGRIDGVALELGFATEEEALAAVGRALGMELVDLATVRIDLSLLEDFPIKFIHRYGVFPIGRRAGSLVVATGNPFDLHALDAVRSGTLHSDG